MDNEIIQVLVKELASLLAWRDQVQNLSFPKTKYEYEHELLAAITKSKQI